MTSNSHWGQRKLVVITLVGNHIQNLIDSTFGFGQPLAKDNKLLMMGDPFTMGDRGTL